MEITTIEQADVFVKNLKRSDNWVSNDELLNKLNICKQLIETHKREDLIPFIYIHLSLYYIDLGEYGQAWIQTEVAKKYAKKSNNLESLLNAISNQYRIQRYLGNLETAQALVNEQIDIALEFNDPIQLFSAFLNQAYQYYLQNQKQECIQAFQKAIEYSKKSNNLYSLAMIYITYSGHLIEYNELKEAEKILNKGFDIAKENEFNNFIALANSNLGILFTKKKKYDDAIRFYLNSIKQYHQLNNTNDEHQVKIMYAEVCLKTQQFSEAEKVLNEVLLFSKNEVIKSNLTDVYHLLSNLYEQKNEYKKSLSYYKKYKKLSDEIYNLETGKQIKNLEIIENVKLLNIEKNNAEKLANIKHDFLANMSHEIRTPINSVLGICYLMEQQALNDIQRNYILRLKRSGENLLGIINDVLDISKIESGKIELNQEVFSLNTILRDVFDALEPKALEKNIKLEVFKKYKKDIHVIGDAIRIYQILLNFVSNAIKFTTVGGVKFTLSIKEKTTESIVLDFHIQDTGIGIAKENIHSIFNRFEQADKTIHRKFGGTGLGLSISKKIVEVLHGKIEVKSKPNHGTVFTISIPFNLPQQQIELIENKEILNSELLTNKIILIADDNEENRLVAKEILLSFNNTIKIMEAEDGTEIIHLMFKKIPDIIFTDLDMPNMNGIEATQKIRQNKNYQHVKIIGNTASLSTFTDEDLQTIGFDDFIYKPFKADELLRKITRIV
jgi:signal transduction histidine kinase/predicted Zn-dependent protease/ActR/RegA family two-component response regulator